MSAWKKPSRSAWVRKLRMMMSAKRSGSCPAARRACGSRSGTPSIHSVVSTRPAVRSQSTAGTRKSASALVRSASSDAAAPSMRRSSSSATEAASVSTSARRRSRRASAETRSARRAAKAKAGKIAREFALDTGPQHFYGDAARLFAGGFCLVHLRDRGGGRRDRRRRRTAYRAAHRALLRPPASPRQAETAAGGPAGLRARVATSAPTMSGRVARIWPSLM